MLARLQTMAERYEQINNLLMNTSFSDAREYGKLSKEQANLQAPVDAYHQLTDVMNKIKENEE